MIDDWPAEIAKAVVVRQHLAAVDTLFEYPLPEVAASEDELVLAERSTGPLDPRYREFLTYANGWRDFRLSIDLFSTEQLRGASPMRSLEEGIAAVGDVSEHVGYELEQMQPIGGSETTTDMWLVARPGFRRAGRVLWFWGSDYEDFESFDEFFLAMVDHNRLALQRLTTGRE
jgi:hypothetical protein